MTPLHKLLNKLYVARLCNIRFQFQEKANLFPWKMKSLHYKLSLHGCERMEKCRFLQV